MMPKIYRSMCEDAGAPRIGGDSNELGVRAPGHPFKADVTLDVNGNVVMDGSGMSAFSSIAPADLKRIPKRLIPLRLAHRVPGAIGDDDLKIWTMGYGAFIPGPMTATLTLNVTGGLHATVCPTQTMSLQQLQTELANTQRDWTIEEP